MARPFKGVHCQQVAEEERAKGQLATLQQEGQGRESNKGKQAGKEAPGPPGGRQEGQQQKVPSPPSKPGLMSALFGRGDTRPLLERLTEVVIDWVELRGDRPVPKPKVAAAGFCFLAFCSTSSAHLNAARGSEPRGAGSSCRPG